MVGTALVGDLRGKGGHLRPAVSQPLFSVDSTFRISAEVISRLCKTESFLCLPASVQFFRFLFAQDAALVVIVPDGPALDLPALGYLDLAAFDAELPNEVVVIQLIPAAIRT